MLNRKPILISDQWQVRQELRALGLTPNIVTQVAKASAAAKAEALEVDPCSTPGTLAYIKGVRQIRLELVPEGWVISRAGNVESTVNHVLGIQLCFQSVDMACTERDPQAISGKGSGSRKLIHAGQQGELFEAPQVATATPSGAVPTVWVLCVSTEEKKLRAEVSCPEIFEGTQFDGFSKRIFVVDEDLDPSPRDAKRPDDGDSGDFEVRIAKK
ncbi:hypothetical protein [Variovorax gossypii]